MTIQIKSIRKIRTERLKNLAELKASSVWNDILKKKLEELSDLDSVIPPKNQWEAAKREIERGVTTKIIKEIIRFVESADKKLSQDYVNN